MHQWVADLCGIPRVQAKTVNLGRAYGMSTAKLAMALGLPTVQKVVYRGQWRDLDPGEDPYNLPPGAEIKLLGGPETMSLLKVWKAKAPFIGEFIDLATRVADQRGYVKTIMGRRCRFHVSNGTAQFGHAAANRVIQGSAADQIKSAMLIMWKEGIIPLLTLHDELNISVATEEEGRRVSQIMETAIPLRIPMICDPHFGANWAEAKLD
jgi:DNA polymerase I-like protein with 3'-5' exonuclease and polymerase domains